MQGQGYAGVAFAIGVVVSVAFAAVALLCIDRVLWDGDFRVYFAAVAELKRSFWHPLHESASATSEFSYAYTPYIYAVGLLAVAGLSPYAALQVAACINVALYLSGVWAFCRVFAGRRQAPVAVVLFLLVTLLLRDQSYLLSSELSIGTLPRVLPYPSTNAWGLGLWTLVVAELGLRGRLEARGAAAVEAVFVAWILASHAITGSWIFGLTGLRAGLAVVARTTAGLWQRSGAPRAQGPLWSPRSAWWLLGGVVLGAGLACLWPNVTFLQSGHFTAVEGQAFRDTPLLLHGRLFALAALWLLVELGESGRLRWRSWFALFAFAAAGVAYAVMSELEIDYRARYAYFFAFAAHALVAIAGARAIWRGAHWLRWRRRSIRSVAIPRRPPAFGLALVVLTILACWQAPTLQDPSLQRRIFSPETLWAMPPARALIAHRSDILRGFLGPGDVVLVSDPKEGMRVAADTGARSVAITWGYLLPDNAERMASTRDFFRRKTPRKAREALLQKWGVTAVLDTKSDANRRSILAGLLGAPDLLHGSTAVWRLQSSK